MRKINKNLFTLLCSLMLLFCLVSCNKVKSVTNVDYGKIDYYVAGVYLEVENYSKFEMNDANPKIYFDFVSGKDFETFVTKTGYDLSAAKYNLYSKKIYQRDGKTVYFANVNMEFVNKDVDSFKVYPIYVNEDNELVINHELSEEVVFNENIAYPFNVDFTNNNKNYKIQITLSIKK